MQDLFLFLCNKLIPRPNGFKNKLSMYLFRYMRKKKQYWPLWEISVVVQVRHCCGCIYILAQYYYYSMWFKLLKNSLLIHTLIICNSGYFSIQSSKQKCYAAFSCCCCVDLLESVQKKIDSQILWASSPKFEEKF